MNIIYIYIYTYFRCIERLIEYAGDESIITTSNRECVLRQFSGQGFRIQDIVYNDMFVSQNFIFFYIYIINTNFNLKY